MAPALFSALIVAIAACAHAAPEPNTLTLAEKTAGWQRLFDGSSLNGWRSYGSDRPPSGWEVVGNAIVRRCKSGDIVTVEAFADFELSIGWKICAGGNSGIVYRASLSTDKTRRT